NRRSAPETGGDARHPHPSQARSPNRSLPMPPVPSPSSNPAAAADAARRATVHKFGGSSLATAARIARIPALVDDGAPARVVVVSAMQGSTDALVAMAEEAAAGRDWSVAAAALRERHLQAATALDGDGRH